MSEAGPFVADDHAALLQLADRLEALGWVAEDPGLDTAAAAAGLRAVVARLPGGGDDPIRLAAPDHAELTLRPGSGRLEIGWRDGLGITARALEVIEHADYSREFTVRVGGRHFRVAQPRDFAQRTYPGHGPFGDVSGF